jgi:hypothetical protein
MKKTCSVLLLVKTEVTIASQHTKNTGSHVSVSQGVSCGLHDCHLIWFLFRVFFLVAACE